MAGEVLILRGVLCRGEETNWLWQRNWLPGVMVRYLVGVILLAGGYFLFAGTVSGEEAVVLLPAVICAGGVAVLVARVAGRRFAFRLAWLRVLARLPRVIVADTILVGRALWQAVWRGHAGVLARQPFDHGGDNAADAARRGLVVLGVSFAPNGYVVRVPRTGEFVLVHRLVDGAAKPDAAWPI